MIAGISRATVVYFGIVDLIENRLNKRLLSTIAQNDYSKEK